MVKTRWLKDRPFIQAVLVLASGTLLSQLIPLLASPILTRLYTPEAFGVFAVFLAIMTSIGPSIAGHYDVASVLPESDEEGRQLFSAAVWSSLILSLAVGGSLFFFGETLLTWLGMSAIDRWIGLLTPGLLLFGFFTTVSYWANRQHEFRFMSQSRVLQSSGIALLSIVLGLIGFQAGGLIVAYMLGFAISVVYLGFRYPLLASLTHFARLSQLGPIASKHKQYPLYSATTGLLDGVTLAMPVFFLTAWFPEAMVGFYALMARVASAPLGVLSLGVSQVTLRRMADLINEGKPVRGVFMRVAATLFLLGLIPSLIFIYAAPAIFAFVFGAEWAKAGEYLQILMPAILIRFVASTLSSTLWATRGVSSLAFWKISAFIVTGSVLSFFASRGDIEDFLIALLWNDIALYSLYLFLIFRSADRASRSG